MKYFIILFMTLFFLAGCGSRDINSDYFIENYDRETLTLDLSHQDFLEVPAFSKYMTGSWLQDIYTIDLSENDIQIIPLGAFDIFPNLSTINLASNDFKFGSDIRLPNTINKLSVANNILDDLNGFENYLGLSRINLSNNNLEDNDLESLGGLTGLVELHVDGNNISESALKKINKLNTTPIRQRAE